MDFTDTSLLSRVRRTDDGYLVAAPRVARTGIQFYSGHELDPDNEHGFFDRQSIAVYRPQEEVFAADAMKSYAHRPVTNGHPPKMVDSSNWKDYAVGQTGEDITRDGESVRVPLVLMDAATIAAVEAGKRELSMGYSADLVFEAGTTPEGETFEVKQTNLRMNHLAIVNAARGGAALRIGDSLSPLRSIPTGKPLTKERKPFMKKFKLADGVLVELSNEDVEKLKTAIDLLQQQILEATARANAALIELEAAKAESDANKANLVRTQTEMEKLQGEDGSKQQEAFDVRVAERSELIARAGLIDGDMKTFTLSDDDIRRTIVSRKLGFEAMQNKPQAYIDARFDILAEEALKTAESALALRANLMAPAKTFDAKNQEQEAYAAMLSRFHKKTPPSLSL